jgi:hypothetical protein
VSGGILGFLGARRWLTSDRAGWQWVLPTARSDDERWRRGRKLLDRGLRPGAAASHRLMLQTRSRVLLSRLLANPKQWEDYIDLSVGIYVASGYIPELFGTI